MTIEEQNYCGQRKALHHRLAHGLSPLIRLPEYFSWRYVVDKKVAPLVQGYILPLYEGIGNGKTIPAFQILLDTEKETNGNFPKVSVVPSSGNFLAEYARLVRWFRPDAEVIGVVESSVPDGKVGQVRIANKNATIIKVKPGESTIEVARKLAAENGYYFVNQYTAKGSVLGHERFTWPHVAKQFQDMGVVPSFACVALGTTSAFVSAYCLQNIWPNFQVVGTACYPDEVIPGARTVKKLEATGFGYKDVIGDRLVLCRSQAAEDMSDSLYRDASLSAGLTTGMAIEASFQFINERGLSLVNGVGEIPFMVPGFDARAPYYASRA